MISFIVFSVPVHGVTFIDSIIDGITSTAGHFFKDALDVVRLLYGRVPDEDFQLLNDVLDDTDDSLLDILFSWSDNDDAEDVSNYIFIGDYRIQQLEEISNSDKDIFISDMNAGYSWLMNEGFEETENYITENSVVVLGIGIHDLYQYQKYIKEINQITEAWSDLGAAVYFMNVGPVSEDSVITNEQVQIFNNKMYQGLENVGYIDIYQKINKTGFTVNEEGMYDSKTLEEIYDHIKRTAGSNIELVSNDGNRVWWSAYAKRDVYNRFTATNWNRFEGMRVNLMVEPVVKARLSEELKPYEKELENAAKQYGFLPYKELFKAIAQYRYIPGNEDIFGMKNTNMDIGNSENLTAMESITIAAELFRDCIIFAGYPTPLELTGLKPVLQAFEFEDESFFEFCNGTYTLEIAQEYAKIMADGEIRLDAREAELYGLYAYKDQKFSDKVLKYYSVISIGSGNMSGHEQNLLTECMAGWSADLDERRKNLIQKGLSLYGSVTYSMDMRLQPRASSPNYLDCSSFVGWSYYYSGLHDVQCWWTTGTFLDIFQKISKSELIPGDVGLINTVGEGGANHIGIYLGNDASGIPVWLHCSSGAGGIVINTYNGFQIYYRYPKF